MSITYKDAQELACLPEVHEALQNFFDNGSEDDAVCLIVVIEAALNSSPAAPTTPASQESASEQAVAAINYIMDDGTHKVVAQRQLPQHAKLYLTPPTSTDIDATVVKKAADKLKAVLCTPEGECCIRGSDGDRKEVDEALALLDSIAPANAEGV